MEKLKEIAADIRSGWEKIEKRQRIQIIALVIIILMILFGLIYFAQRTEYRVLFSELEEADAGAIVEDLESRGMEYKLEDDGTTILIDEDLVDEYRIDIAVDGPMPSTSTGFEIFDSSNLMATDEDRAIMYQRAISGELERAIDSIGSVKSSKVLLNIPETSVFQNPEYQKEATASVILEMNNGQSPSVATIQGIGALVAGAVDNLPESNVEIVDTNGNLLSSTGGSGNQMGSDIVSEHQRIKRMVETDLEHQVISLLAPVFGYDKVYISVNTELNFDAIESEATEYGESHIRSQTESVTGNAALADRVQSGVLDDNNVAVIEEIGEEDNSFYEHTTNFELDTTTSRIVEAPGSIERITASVVIMDNPADRGAIQGIVENALGVNNMRNPDEGRDSVQIEYLMPSADEAESMGGLEFMENIVAWSADNWWVLAAGLILLVLVIVLTRLFTKRTSQAEDDYYDYEYDLDESMMEPDEEFEEAVSDDEEEQTSEEDRSDESKKEDLVHEQTKENPELAAELIKVWLNEDAKDER